MFKNLLSGLESENASSMALTFDILCAGHLGSVPSGLAEHSLRTAPLFLKVFNFSPGRIVFEFPMVKLLRLRLLHFPLRIRRLLLLLVFPLSNTFLDEICHFLEKVQLQLFFWTQLSVLWRLLTARILPPDSVNISA